MDDFPVFGMPQTNQIKLFLLEWLAMLFSILVMFFDFVEQAFMCTMSKAFFVVSLM
jgi:hypothetical protein